MIWFYLIIYLFLFQIWYKPTLVLYHSLKAGHMLKKRDYDGVSTQYQKIAKLKKNDGFGDYAEGLAYYYQKEWLKAGNSFERALEKGIKYQQKTIEPLTKMALITTYIQLNKWNKAGNLISQMEKEMEEGKKLPVKLHAVFYPLKGEFLYHKKEAQSALQAFKHGYARYPELMGEEAYYYAQLLISMNLKEDAREILKQLLEDKQQWKLFRINLSDVQDLYDELSS